MEKTISQAQVSVDGARRIDLDWLRIGAFGLLILYHVGMLYVSWDFHVKSQHRVAALEPLMLAINPWRLALLFLVSGVATRFMVRKYAPARLLMSRTARLLPPLVFGMLVVVPPQAYDQVVESMGYGGSFLEFYLSRYLTFGVTFCQPGPCLVLPTWNHLWFVAYLWVYTMVLGAALVVMPDLGRRAERASAAILSGVVLVVPALLFALYRLVLLPRFPSTQGLMDDWYNHAVYGTVFLFGFVFAHADGVWSQIGRLRWPALLLAAGVLVSGLVLRSLYASGQPLPLPLKIYAEIAYGFYQWLSIVAVLGFAQRWLTRDSPARRYLTNAVFPYYIVHQTAIIAIAHQLKDYALPAWCEAAIVIAGTMATCIVTYEAVRRVAPLRPFFGLRFCRNNERVTLVRRIEAEA
jgi:nicotinamide riboside transporter PnuC